MFPIPCCHYALWKLFPWSVPHFGTGFQAVCDMSFFSFVCLWFANRRCYMNMYNYNYDYQIEQLFCRCMYVHTYWDTWYTVMPVKSAELCCPLSCLCSHCFYCLIHLCLHFLVRLMDAWCVNKCVFTYLTGVMLLGRMVVRVLFGLHFTSVVEIQFLIMSRESCTLFWGI